MVDTVEELVDDTIEELDANMVLQLETEPKHLIDKAYQDIMSLLYKGTKSKALGLVPFVVLSLFERRLHLPRTHSFYIR